MKFNKWTVGLATAGVVSLGSVVMADESPISTLVSGTTIGGAVDTSAQWKPSSGSTMANRFANTAPNHYNGFNLEYVELRIEKPLDEGQWSAGYTAALWLGQDAAWLPVALGGQHLAIKQAYVTMRAPLGNGLDFKIGQVDSLIGYESLSLYKNPNFSRSLGSYIEPWSQTGIVASYQAAEWVGLSGSIANSSYGDMNAKEPFVSAGWGNPTTASPFAKGNGLLTYSGAVTFKAPESWGWLAGSALYGGIVDSLVTNQRNYMNYYAGLSLPTPIKEVTLGFAYDFGDRSWDAYGLGGIQNTYAQAVSGYISWQVTEKLRFNTRVEYANASSSESGVWITPLLGEIDGYTVGSRERLLGLTGTLEYQLWDNVVSRLEALWNRNLIGTGNSGPFNGNNNSVLLMANIAYKF
ncbi:MAG: outer membrane beta-barrel protein [Verrucomicrobiota bacterium]